MSFHLALPENEGVRADGSSLKDERSIVATKKHVIFHHRQLKSKTSWTYYFTCLSYVTQCFASCFVYFLFRKQDSSRDLKLSDLNIED